MRGLSNKVKIVLIIVLFAAFAAGMLLYGYKIMGGKNQAVSDLIMEKKIELDTLDREQKSFNQGKRDLALLRQSAFPPDELFSSNTKVVNEIQQLESAAQRYDLNLRIEVRSNTSAVPEATVPKTTAGLQTVPYVISVDGPFPNVLKFIKTVERLPFITHAKSLQINVDDNSIATTVIASDFYLKVKKE